MSWTTIALSDLKDAKAAALVEACQTKALGAGQTDPTANIIANVIARIRAEIAGCSANRLDRDTTLIPTDLKSLGCRMILREMQSRLQYPLSDDEREEQRNDLRYLERIARCEVPIETPDDPVTPETQGRVGTPDVTERTREFSRDAQEGI